MFYGSQTGTAEEFAGRLAKDCASYGMKGMVVDPEECEMVRYYLYMSHVVRKPAFCICINKDVDQLRGNREADQRLCFHYTDSTIPLVSKSEISSL